MIKLKRHVVAAIFTAFLLIVWQEKKLYSNLNESLMMIWNLEKNPIKND